MNIKKKKILLRRWKDELLRMQLSASIFTCLRISKCKYFAHIIIIYCITIYLRVCLSIQVCRKFAGTNCTKFHHKQQFWRRNKNHHYHVKRFLKGYVKIFTSYALLHIHQTVYFTFFIYLCYIYCLSVF